MPKYETIQDYLRAVEEQIRWKRAWPVLCRELRQHMEDQRDDFAAQGFADAEQMAVAEMGDPVPVGVELDRLHRPKPQRGLLAMTVVLALAGGFLRVWLTYSARPSLDAFSQKKTVLALVLGIVVLLGGYFLDLSPLLRRPKTVYTVALAAGIFLYMLWLISPVGKMQYFVLLRHIVQFYPVVYALWLYGWRGKGWAGFLGAVAGGIPLTLVSLLGLSAGNALILLLSGFILLLFAIWKDWFRVSKPAAIAFLAGLAVTLVSLILLRYGSSQRIEAVFHPEKFMSASGYLGYQGTTVRQALAASRWFGEGAAGFAPYPFEQYVPEWSRDFLLTTIVYKLGWLPFMLVVLAMTGLLVWVVCRWSRHQAGQMLVLSVVMIFSCRIVCSVALNLGFVLFSFGFPLLTWNLQSIVDMGLLGLALSVLRNGSILRESSMGPEASPHIL